MFDSFLAETLETARSRFVEKHGHLVSNTSPDGRETWIKNSSVDPIGEAVDHAMKESGVSCCRTRKEIYSSLKFRVLAGTVTRPIQYHDEIQGGVCKNLTLDPDTDTWDCVVSGNQETADNWHAHFGYSPACPYWEPPMEENRDERTEFDFLLEEDDERTAEDARRILGLE